MRVRKVTSLVAYTALPLLFLSVIPVAPKGRDGNSRMHQAINSQTKRQNIHRRSFSISPERTSFNTDANMIRYSILKYPHQNYEDKIIKEPWLEM